MLFGSRPYAMDGRMSDLSFLKSNVTLDEISDDRTARLSRGGDKLGNLRLTVRNTENGRIFYVLNLSDYAERDITLHISECEGVNVLDMQTLEAHGAVFTRDVRGVSVHFDLAPAESIVFVEDGSARSAEKTAEPQNFIKLSRVLPFVSMPVNCVNLDCAQLSRDGGEYTRPLPIPCIKDMLFRERYEGRVSLRYSFSTDTRPADISVAVEPMKNCTVTVNGEEITFDNGWWYDRTFRTAAISDKIKKGRNEIIVSFDYFQREHVYYVLFGGVTETMRNCLSFDTEIESIYLFGSFCADTDKERYEEGVRNSLIYSGEFTVTEQRDTVDTSDIVRDGYPFYGGCIDVIAEYDYKSGDATVLKLDGRYSLCDVEVNGKRAPLMMFTDRTDLSEYLREGKNEIRLKLYNSMRNLIGPHHRHDPEPWAVSPNTFSFEGEWDGEKCDGYVDSYAFVRFGIET